jgi:hypothetical protein
MAAGGARARQRAGRDQRSGSTGRTLAATGVYARSVSFTLVSLRMHREQAQRLASDMEGSKEPLRSISPGWNDSLQTAEHS